MLNFAMFPTDKGISVSKYVSKVIEMIRDNGVDYKLNPMGTTIETETMAEALTIIEKAHEILSKDADRIYSSITIDAKTGSTGRMISKIASIEEKIGSVNS